MSKQKNVLVIFDKELPRRLIKFRRIVDIVLAREELQQDIEEIGFKFVSIEQFIEPGSIYEASSFAEELSRLSLPNGTRVSESFMYKGYELWWMHYNNLFLHFCLPYTQYRKLLEYVRNFQNAYFFRPPYKSLFSCYLKAHGCNFKAVQDFGLKASSFFPFGILLQIFITFLSILVLVLRKRSTMIFTGDKFEKKQDYDFRMRFIYEELRQRNIHFVEFIRSLESWKTVFKHAIKRKRPVIYSEAVTFVGRFISVVFGGHSYARRKFGFETFSSCTDPDKLFKFMVATQYLLGVYDDVWSIRIMRWILRIIGIKVAFVAATLERNFHSVFGCKLNKIPTVGILHGVASRHYNVYDFLPGFDGAKILSVDKYGLWSDWWKEYYIKNSKAYLPEQLHVSGLMRPLESKDASFPISKKLQKKDEPIKVLFVPGELSEPKEIMTYLLTLMDVKSISVYLTFRPYRDRFEEWLKKNDSEFIYKIGKEKILRGSIHSAISQCDVVVGTYSTAALEALLQLKPLVFFKTNKWGDYFEMKNYDSEYKFFAENPKELVDYIIDNKDIPEDILKKLQERFFGDPCKNGSKWVVNQIEKVLQKTI